MSVLQTLLPFLRAEIHHDRQYPGTKDPYQKKYEVVQAVEAVNDFYKGSGKNLLLMTPHVWRISKEGAQRLAQTSALEDCAEVIVNIYGRQTD